jgi:hypothetical protein
MLNTDHVPPRASFWHPERKAWTVMLLAFAIFCGLAYTGTRALYRFALLPEQRSILATVAQPDAVFVQRATRVQSVVLANGEQINAGDRITTSDKAWPGIVTRLHLDQGTVALWPATNMLVEARDRSGMRFVLEDGQALIELQADDEPVYWTSKSLAQEVELQAPGRYRLRVLSPTATTTAAAERSLAPGVEVVADSGQARIGEIAIAGGERRVLGRHNDPLPNVWNLVRDGDFDHYSSTEYLATLQAQTESRRSDTWIITQQPQSAGAFWRNGLFYLMDECPTESTCRNYARLARLGGNEKDSITAISQSVSADVSSYRTITLKADVKIDYQSLSRGGADGSECPLFARVDYASDVATKGNMFFCFWAFDRGGGNVSSQPYIVSTQIPPNTWYPFSADLGAHIPDLRMIEQVVFYSNGHDYDASVASVSLQAEGLAEARQP